MSVWEYRSIVVGSEESSFGTLACQDMGLGAEKLNRVKFLELAAAEMTRKKIRLCQDDFRFELK
jgi:hypothetical protein